MRTSEELARWQGYLTIPEVRLLKKLAQGLPHDPLIVNIGAGAGTSTLAFAEARPDALILSIDIQAAGNELATNEHQRLKEAGLADTGQVIRIWGDSAVVGQRWRWPADLVFVDGDHEFPGVRRDVEVWPENVAPGGLILFHDYGSYNWPHVKAAVDAALRGWRQVALVDTTIAFIKGEAQ